MSQVLRRLGRVAASALLLATLSCTDSLVPGPQSPVLQLSTSHLVFGAIMIGQSREQTFTVMNAGGGTLTGEVAAPCSTVSLLTEPHYSLLPGQSKVFRVRFLPARAGIDTCTLRTGPAGSPLLECTGTALAWSQYYVVLRPDGTFSSNLLTEVRLQWDHVASLDLGCGLAFTFLPGSAGQAGMFLADCDTCSAIRLARGFYLERVVLDRISARMSGTSRFRAIDGTRETTLPDPTPTCGALDLSLGYQPPRQSDTERVGLRLDDGETPSAAWLAVGEVTLVFNSQLYPAPTAGLDRMVRGRFTVLAAPRS